MLETFNLSNTIIQPDINLFQVNDVIGGGIIRNNIMNPTTEITNEVINDIPFDEQFFEEQNIYSEEDEDNANTDTNEPDITEAYVDEKFEYNCSKYKSYVCIECKRGYILNQKHIETQFVCKDCRNKVKHFINNFFSDERNQPCKIPEVLRPYKLTMIEQQLIALVHVSQNVYHRGKGSVATSGHCINYAQDITPIAKVLPHLPKDVPLIIIRAPNVSIQTPDMLIRRKHVLVWLEWLLKNNPVYKDYAENNNLIIDYARINDLPENGYADDYNVIETDFDVHREPPVSEQNALNSQQSKENSQINNEIEHLSQVIQSSFNITTEPLLNTNLSEDENEQEENEISDIDHPYYTGVVDPPPLISEEDQLNSRLDEILKLDFPKHDVEPLNEYRTPNLATMAFPCLFPDGKGDPFACSETDERFYLKIKYLVNFCEIVHEMGRDKKEYRFARDSRFVLWIFNIYYRRRCREIGTVYMSKCPGDSNTTIQSLKALINMGAKNNVIRNMQKYMAQIQGTASYWFQCSEDLKAIIRDKGPPYVFFTFTYATHHDPHLHRVIGLKPDANRDEINKALEENTHIVNQFFTLKFKEFKKLYFEKYLKSTPENEGWLWYRYEWQFRDAIHVHGLARFGKQFFDPYKAVDKALKGNHIQKQQFEGNPLFGPLTEQEQAIVQSGLNAEENLKKFYDEFQTSDASISYEEWNIAGKDMEKKPMAKLLSEVEDHEQDLLDLTYLLQKHKCLINKCFNKKTGNTVTQCRFKFPKSLLEATVVTYHRHEFKDGRLGPWQLKIKTYRVNSRYIVEFNKLCMRNWRGNHNFSLTSNVEKVLIYCSKYTTKCETKSSLFNNIFKSVLDDAEPHLSDTKITLQKIMNKVLGERDITRNEALHILMGLDMHESNVTVVRTSLDYNYGLRNNKKTGEAYLAKSYPEKYANRLSDRQYGNQLKNTNFLDFVRRFDNKYKDGVFWERSKPGHIVVRINQQFSSSNKNPNYWQHCKYQLLRYKPWTNDHLNVLKINPDDINEIIEDTPEVWIAGWADFLKNQSSLPPNKRIIEDWQKRLNVAENLLEEINNEEENYRRNEDGILDDDESNEYSSESDCDLYEREVPPEKTTESWMQLQQQRKDRIINKHNLDHLLDAHNPEFWSKLQLQYEPDEYNTLTSWLLEEKERASSANRNIDLPVVDIGQLNVKQRRIYNLIVRRLKKNKQTLLRTEGGGGVGKSFLIKAINGLGNFLNCAPTGKAATAIGGQTIHSLLNIFDVNNKRTYNPLRGKALATLQQRILQSKIRGIIIDEYSMVGCKMLYLINERLKQAMNNHELFGGLNIILVGDTKQLPAVLDSVLWKIPSKSTDEMSNNASQGHYLYKQFKLVVELTENLRQLGPEQQRFREFLNRLRHGKCIAEDWNLLTPCISSARREHEFKDTICLMPSRAEVRNENFECLKRLMDGNKERNPGLRINAIHSDLVAQSMSADHFRNLESSIIIARNSRVMLTTNDWTEVGLTNGAMGHVRDIIFDTNQGPPNMPKAIVVELDEGYNGPHLPNKPRHVVITPKTNSYESYNNKTYERTQFPLVLAYALTVHKSQGMTLHKVRVSLGSSDGRNRGMTYVALSRVTDINNLLIYYQHFTVDRLVKIQLDADMIAHDLRTERLILETELILAAEEAEEEAEEQIHNENDGDNLSTDSE